MTDNNEEKEKEETKFCADCRIEYKVSEMKRQKVMSGGIFTKKEIIK